MACFRGTPRKHAFSGEACEKHVENSVTIYWFEYAYDQLGNRMVKYDRVTDTQTDYYYDADINLGGVAADADDRLPLSQLPTPWQDLYQNGTLAVESVDNRLVYYIERPIKGGKEEVTREVSYTYYESGNVAHIAVKDAGNDYTRGLAMYYAANQSLWRVLWDRWEGGVRGPFDNYTILGMLGDGPSPREFYYNGSGGRYLSRQMYITGSSGNYDWDVLAGENALYVDEFTDILGLTPTSDFTSRLRHTMQEIQNPPTPPLPILTQGNKYLNDGSLMGREHSVGGAEEYWHGDLVGSTMRLTDSSGAQSSTAVRYTAFGEVVTGSQGSPPGGIGGQLPSQFSRYGYVGEYGYESDMLVLAGATGTKPIVLSHVGARWYDPGIGRFAQRDPIGLGGGINPYAYADHLPNLRIDPNGMTSWGPNPNIPQLPNPFDGTPRDWLRRLSIPKPFFRALMNTPVKCLLAWKGLLAGAAGAGWAAGRAIDAGFGASNEGFCISDGLADILVNGLPPLGEDNWIRRLGESGGHYCFVEGTLVETESGAEPIESISADDALYSGDLSSGKQLARVIAVYRSHTRELLRVRMSCGAVTCTARHPFRVVGRGWVDAGDLRSGDILASRDGHQVTVTVVEPVCVPQPVAIYNLTVDGDHTYFVGPCGVLVHNKW